MKINFLLRIIKTNGDVKCNYADTERSYWRGGSKPALRTFLLWWAKTSAAALGKLRRRLRLSLTRFALYATRSFTSTRQSPPYKMRSKEKISYFYDGSILLSQLFVFYSPVHMWISISTNMYSQKYMFNFQDLKSLIVYCSLLFSSATVPKP